MSLLFFDGFDHYTSILQKWDAIVTSTPSISATAANAHFGVGQYVAWTVVANAQVRKNLASNYSTLIAGGAFMTTSQIPNSMGCLLFLDNGTAQLCVGISIDGSVQVRRGTMSGTLLYTSATDFFFIRDDIWYFIEAKVVFHGSTGSVQIKVNGVTLTTLTNQNTISSANAYANQFAIGGGGGSSAGFAVRYDDIYVCDTAGSLNNDFLGDIAIRSLLPTGAGSSTQWTASAGSNYQCVDESGAPNDDTDYVSDSTTGHKDLYAMGDLGSNVTAVKAVQVLYRSRKDDAGTRTLKGKIKHSSSEGNGADQAQSSSYVYYRDIFETNPSTSSAWTGSEVNAAEAGVEVVA